MTSLDAQVAQVVMAWQVLENNLGTFYFRKDGTQQPGNQTIPLFSTSIADAFQVVEAMIARKYAWQFQSSVGKWWAAVFENGTQIASKTAPTLPEAICVVALKALGKQPGG